jgi:hypothetical protein
MWLHKQRKEHFFKLILTVRLCFIHRVVFSGCQDILVHGRLYVTTNYLCFYANIFTWETAVTIRWKDVSIFNIYLAIGQYYSLSRTNDPRAGGYAGGRPGEDEYGKREAGPEGEGTRDSPSIRAAGRKGEGCRKRRWTSSVAIGHRSFPPLSVGGRFKLRDRQPTAGISVAGGVGARRPGPTQHSAVGR